MLQLECETSKMEETKPISLGQSSNLLVGQKVYAIGNPFGLDHTLTQGIVSGVGRELNTPGVTLDNHVMHSIRRTMFLAYLACTSKHVGKHDCVPLIIRSPCSTLLCCDQQRCPPGSTTSEQPLPQSFAETFSTGTDLVTE